MKKTSTYSAVLVAALIIGLAGCDGGLTAPEERAAEPEQSVPSKVRYAHLMGTNTIMNAGGGQSAQLLISFNDAAIDADRLLRRYQQLRRYRLLRRYEDGQEVPYAVGAELEGDDLDDGDDFDDVLEDLLDSLGVDDDVVFVEPDAALDDMPGFTEQENEGGQLTPWGVENVGGASTAAGVDLYLLDSGTTPADLNVVEERDFVERARPADAAAHGVHVAGTAAALDNEEGVVGVAPGLRVRSFRVLDENGQTQLSTAAAALQEVRARKLQNPSQPIVVNMSFGADVGGTEPNALDRAVEDAVAAGVVVVLSAGNDGIDAATVSPAHTPSALTVGA